MAARTLEITFIGNPKPLQDAMGHATTSVQQFGAKVEESTSPLGRMGSAVGHLASIAGGFVIAESVMQLPGFLMDAAKAAAEDEQSTARLSATIRSLGGDYESQLAAVNAAISANQKLGFSDDETRDSFDKLAQATGNTKEALERQRLAMDLARGANIPLADASKLLGKVTDENLQVFKRMGITLPDVASEADVLAAVQKKFAGQADAYAHSTAGQFAILKDRLEEAKETIGYALLPIATSVAGVMAEKVAPAIEKVAGFAADLASLSWAALQSAWEAIAPVLERAAALSWDALVALAGVSWDRMQSAWESISEKMGSVDWGKLKDSATDTSNWASAWESVSDALQPAIDVLRPMVEGLLGDLKSQFDEVKAALRPLLEAFAEWEPVLKPVAEIIGVVIVAEIAVFLVTARALVQFLTVTFVAAINVVTAVIRTITEAVRFVTNAFEEWPGAIAGLLSSAAGKISDFVGKAKSLFGGMADAVASTFDTVKSTVTGGWNAVTGVFDAAWGTISGWLESNWRTLANVLLLPIAIATAPIRLAWGEITGVFDAAWSTVSGWLSASWNTLSGLLSAVLDTASGAIGTAWGAITGAFDAAWGTISGWLESNWRTLANVLLLPIAIATAPIRLAWGEITGVFDAAWSTVSGWLSASWNTLSGLLSAVLDTASGAIGTAWGAITGAFDAAWTTVSGWLESSWSTVQDKLVSPITGAVTVLASIGSDFLAVGGKIIGGIVSGIGDAAMSIRDAVWSAKDTAFGQIGNAADWLVGVGWDVLRGLASGITAGAGMVKDALESIYNNLPGWAKDVLEIFSPSKVMAREVGEPISAGVAAGIEAGIPQVQAAMQALTDAVGAGGHEAFDHAQISHTSGLGWTSKGSNGAPVKRGPKIVSRVTDGTGELIGLWYEDGNGWGVKPPQGLPHMAAGGIVTRPTVALIGESGPEAVVPLNRAGGVGGAVINLVVQAIDAATFESWLARGGADTILRQLNLAAKRAGRPALA